MKEHYDFQHAKRGPVEPVGNKVRITIRFDPKIIDWFKGYVIAQGGGSYQTLINDALLEYIANKQQPLEKTLRKVIREEMKFFTKAK